MARPKRNQDEIVGQDSFLDIVANLVGIMIILVMVVGARAKDAIAVAETATPKPLATAKSEKEVAAAKAIADGVEADFKRIQAEMQRQKLELAYRQQERDRVQMLVAQAERVLADQRQTLTESQQREFDQQKEILAAESELEELRRSIGHIETTSPETAIIEHLPTPMAKTVFGRELHLRLRHGRVAYVPWDEFVARLKEEAPRKVSRLRDEPEVTDSIGPLGGFWMRYTLKRESQVLQGKAGVAVQQMVVLDKFVLLPEAEQMGERLEDALAEDSQLNTILAGHRPAATTVTVWLYSDSFEEFRKLKRALFDRGFVTAARPLPDDHPIGGSPEGTRSAAQ